MPPRLPQAILEFLAHRQALREAPAKPSQITAGVCAPRATVNRHLRDLVATGQIARQGTGPATCYEYREPFPVTSTAGRAREALPALLEDLLLIKCRHGHSLDQPCADCAVSFLAEEGERTVIFEGGVSQTLKALRDLLGRSASRPAAV